MENNAKRLRTFADNTYQLVVPINIITNDDQMFGCKIINTTSSNMSHNKIITLEFNDEYNPSDKTLLNYKQMQLAYKDQSDEQFMWILKNHPEYVHNMNSCLVKQYIKNKPHLLHHIINGSYIFTEKYVDKWHNEMSELIFWPSHKSDFNHIIFDHIFNIIKKNPKTLQYFMKRLFYNTFLYNNIYGLQYLLDNNMINNTIITKTITIQSKANDKMLQLLIDYKNKNIIQDIKFDPNIIRLAVLYGNVNFFVIMKNNQIEYEFTPNHMMTALEYSDMNMLDYMTKIDPPKKVMEIDQYNLTQLYNNKRIEYMFYYLNYMKDNKTHVSTRSIMSEIIRNNDIANFKRIVDLYKSYMLYEENKENFTKDNMEMIKYIIDTTNNERNFVMNIPDSIIEFHCLNNCTNTLNYIFDLVKKYDLHAKDNSHIGTIINSFKHAIINRDHTTIDNMLIYYKKYLGSLRIMFDESTYMEFYEDDFDFFVTKYEDFMFKNSERYYKYDVIVNFIQYACKFSQANKIIKHFYEMTLFDRYLESKLINIKKMVIRRAIIHGNYDLLKYMNCFNSIRNNIIDSQCKLAIQNNHRHDNICQLLDYILSQLPNKKYEIKSNILDNLFCDNMTHRIVKLIDYIFTNDQIIIKNKPEILNNLANMAIKNESVIVLETVLKYVTEKHQIVCTKDNLTNCVNCDFRNYPKLLDIILFNDKFSRTLYYENHILNNIIRSPKLIDYFRNYINQNQISVIFSDDYKIKCDENSFVITTDMFNKSFENGNVHAMKFLLEQFENMNMITIPLSKFSINMISIDNYKQKMINMFDCIKCHMAKHNIFSLSMTINSDNYLKMPFFAQCMKFLIDVNNDIPITFREEDIEINVHSYNFNRNEIIEYIELLKLLKKYGKYDFSDDKINKIIDYYYEKIQVMNIELMLPETR